MMLNMDKENLKLDNPGKALMCREGRRRGPRNESWCQKDAEGYDRAWQYVCMYSYVH